MAEGPIHAEEVIAKIRSLWNRDRGGSRIQAKVTNALRIAASRNQVLERQDFI